MADFEWDIATSCLTEYDADGFLGVQIDVDGGNDGAAPSFEAHFPTGFYSRPRDPEVGTDGLPITGINVLYAWEGDNGHAFPLGDPAVIQRLPKLSKGSTIIYAQTDAGQLAYVRMSGKDGSLCAYVPGANLGSYIKLGADGTFDMSNPYGRIQHGGGGVSISHTSGAAIDMGAVGGLASPLDQLGSYISLEAAMIHINGIAVSIGTDGGAANEIAQTALSTFAGAVGIFASAVSVAVGKATPASGITAADIAALATAATALSSAATALAPLCFTLGKPL